MNFLAKLEQLSKTFWIILGLVFIGVIGALDFLTGYELAFSLFYLIPIFLLAWFTGRPWGIAASLVSTLAWLFADILAGNTYSKPLIPVWNTLVRFGFFVITASLLSTLKKALNHEKELAQIDYLTGAVNSRVFYHLLQMEIDRFQRYQRAFTLVYIDLDNFKSANDQFGHSVGDQILRAVVTSAQSQLRKTDSIARLGGDEFGLLLSETDPQDAHIVITRIQATLSAEMRRHNWPITFSCGVLICKTASVTPDELLRMADELMYAGKREQKNSIQTMIYEGKGEF